MITIIPYHYWVGSTRGYIESDRDYISIRCVVEAFARCGCYNVSRHSWDNLPLRS